MQASVKDRWLEVTCDASDRAVVKMGVTKQRDTQPPGEWLDAYRDHNYAGERVAKIRPPFGMGSVNVWIDIDGQRTRLPRPVTV